MNEPTIQIITRPAEPPDPEPKPEPQVVWRDENGKIYFRHYPTFPMLRYPNSKAAIEKPDDDPSKCKDCTRECLMAIPNEEIEKEIRELELENDKDGEDPEPKKPKYNFDREMYMLSRKGASKVDIYKASKRPNKKETLGDFINERDALKKEKVGLSKERSALIKALKVKKAKKIREETPDNITEKNIAEMKKLSEFISARIKRWNKHDEPKSEQMAKEDTKYTLETLYRHLPNSFVDFEYEEEIDVCRVLDLPCYGRAFGEDIEDHLHGPEHMAWDHSMKGRVPLYLQYNRVKREVDNGLSYQEGLLAELAVDPYSY
ncbi:hypothetical protein FACUT_8195 [Fusarium acutatum]|uniref:4Fe-4S ferredoxin-type domain-containing protein n=1 Tax=Fusarium acutatum TaxID=78861 RepID=A0A8H4NGI7_9HYPO|nr:hypothetical protein FACUT_8195 [Fusarium acutatum]